MTTIRHHSKLRVARLRNGLILTTLFAVSSNTVLGTETVDFTSSESRSAEAPPGVLSDVSGTIDSSVRSDWELFKVEPAQQASDPVFARRVYLDLIGRVPTQSELQQFLELPHAQKREQLVDTLLATDEHAVHFAQVYDAILVGRTSKEWLDRRTQAGWIAYLERAVRENRPWNQLAEEILLARNEEAQTKGANWYLFARRDKPQEIAEAVSKDFFGVRIDCAQCHDHPLASEIEQRHYWGLVAFFNRTKNVGSSSNPRLSESAVGGFSDFSNIEGESYPNKLVFLGDREVDEERPAADAKIEDSADLYVESSNEGETASKDYQVPKFSRREQFVNVVLKDHPMLAKSMVNRMWGWMMGRGIVHPVDAIDSYHPASHPELLEELTADFAASGYDVKRLVRALALSDVYQLDSVRQTASSKPLDPAAFAIFPAKPLTAEMLHRSILTVLEPKDPAHWGSVESRLAFARLFPDVLAEESIANVSQSLMLTNGDWINKATSPQHSQWIDHLVTNYADKPAAFTDEVFSRIFAREPDDEERARLTEFLESRSATPERVANAFSSIVWAMLSSSEFRFNH